MYCSLLINPLEGSLFTISESFTYRQKSLHSSTAPNLPILVVSPTHAGNVMGPSSCQAQNVCIIVGLRLIYF